MLAFCTSPNDSSAPQPGQLAPPNGTAAAPPTRLSTAPLTLEEALALAGTNSPLLKASAAQMEGARSSIIGARAYTNPEANFLLGNQYERLPTSVPGFMQHYGVSQRIELPSIRRARLALANAGAETARLSMSDTQLVVASTVKQAFYQVLRRQAEVELAEEDLQLANDLHRRISVQVSTGEAARLELTRAEAEITNISTLVKNARLNVLTSKSQLKAAIGAPGIDSLNVQGTLQPRIDLPPLQNLMGAVMGRYPAIQQAEAEVRGPMRRFVWSARGVRPSRPLSVSMSSSPISGSSVLGSPCRYRSGTSGRDQ